MLLKEKQQDQQGWVKLENVCAEIAINEIDSVLRAVRPVS
jgi:hypothetical protein